MLKRILAFMNVTGKNSKINEPVHSDNIEETLNVEYLSQDGFLLHLDIFRPQNTNQKTPVAIVIHGGGFVGGNQTMEAPFSRILASKGVLVYSIDYRIVDKCLVFEPIKDVISGFDYVLSRIDDDNGDKNRIYVISESAGTYAGIYAQAFCKNDIFKKWVDYKTVNINVKGNVFVSGMFYANKSDFVGLLYKKKLFGKLVKDKELMRLMNPECQEVLSVIPKSSFITSNYDFLEDYTLQYQAAFNVSNSDNLLLTFEGDKTLSHAFATLQPDLTESKQAMEKVISYFYETKNT